MKLKYKLVNNIKDELRLLLLKLIRETVIDKTCGKFSKIFINDWEIKKLTNIL